MTIAIDVQVPSGTARGAQQPRQCEAAAPEADGDWDDGGPAPDIAGTPGMAAAYAEFIVRYWDTAAAAGDLDAGEPVYVLELGAGAGRFTYLLIQALQQALAQSRTAYRLRYLAADAAAENLDFIASHPRLRRDLEAGRLDTVSWNAEGDGSLRMRRQRGELRTDNPLVAVANGVFAGLAHDLYGFAYGRAHAGSIRPLRRAAAAADAPGGDYEFEWRPFEAAGSLPPAWVPLFTRYAERLDHAAVPFPSGTMRCLDRLAALSDGRYLLLAADPGIHAESHLRLGTGMDAAIRAGSLPLNFHALTEYQRAQGAWVWNDCHRGRGTVLHAAVRARDEAAYRAALAPATRCLERAHPDHYAALKRTLNLAADRLAPEQLLSLLRLGGYDDRLLAAMLAPLSARLDALTHDERRSWREAVARAWTNHYPFDPDDPFAFNLGVFAMNLGHWGLAKEALGQVVADDAGDIAAWCALSFCQASSGRMPEALASIERAWTLDPAYPDCADFRVQLQQRAGAWNAAPWYRPGCASDAELTLEPLGPEHAASFLQQYRDPQIGVMARLPELQALDEVLAWIDGQRREPDRATYAVMHGAWGFVGVVSFCHDGSGAYFYFWIGADYQDAGLGQRAAALLFRQAAALGLRDVYSSAYADNARSLHAMTRLGFSRLDVAAEPPDEELLFFHRSLAEAAPDRGDPVRRFQSLCHAIESPIQLRIPPAPPDTFERKPVLLSAC